MEKKLILIAHDSEYDLRVLHQVLTRFGYEVLPAGSGEEAFTLARSYWPDLILIDLGLFGKDEDAHLHQLRDLARALQVPVGGLVGRSFGELQPHPWDAELGGRVSLPLRPRLLREAVKRCMARSVPAEEPRRAA